MYKIGILGAADIAYRMFVPALKQCPHFECVGVANLILLFWLSNSIKAIYQHDLSTLWIFYL